MDDIDLSLDDIIKKRFQKNSKPVPKSNIPKKIVGDVKRRRDVRKPMRNGITDARQKILHNKIIRQTVDIVPDARFRLEALRRNRRAPTNALFGNSEFRTKPMPSGDLGTRRLFDRIMHLPSMNTDEFEGDVTGDSLMRSVKNDAYPRRSFDWDRPVEDDEMGFERLRRSSNSRMDLMSDDPDWRNLKLTVKNHSGPMSILKRPQNANTISSLAYQSVSDMSSHRTLSERFCRDRSLEAATKIKALKAYMHENTLSPKPSSSSTGHRIIVSNLVPSVTNDDVKELFGDIGDLLYSKVVRPGVAEVVYERYEDALKAVDVYHDRQLDDQPMKCLLVKSNQSMMKKPKGSNVELDMDALRNALHKVNS